MINETISVDAGPAIGALDELAAAAARADEAMAKLKVPSISASGAGNMARGLDAAAAKVEAAVGKMEASFARLKAVGAEAGSAMGSIGKAGAESAAGLGDASKAANDAAASYARLGKASRDSAVMMDEQTVASKRMGKASAEAGAASQGFFSKHKELILGTGLALGYAVDKAMKFDASMTLLNTQAGVSVKQMPQLTKGVLELAGQVGQSPGNLAESLYHVESNMASLGIKAPQALKMVKIAAEGASVGHANLVDVTNALTAAVASGIPGVKNYSQAMGVLNTTVGAGDMSMQDLADAFSTGLLATVKGYGVTMKDVGAGLATFGDNNIRGAKAGTELRMAIQALAVPASSAKTQLKELGLTTNTLASDMKSGGMMKALDDLTARFKAHGVGAKDMGEVITTLFGKKAGSGIAVLLEQMDRLKSKYPDLTKGANEFGAAWNKTLQTPQQRLNNLIQGTQALAITAGNTLLPYVNKGLGAVDTGLGWLQQHSLANKGLALGAGALVVGGITKGLFSGVESALSGFGKLGSALRIPGMDKLANLGQSTGLAASASALDGAAASLEGAAASLKGAGVAGAVGKDAAAAESAAGSKIGAGIGKAIGGAITVAIALAISKSIIDHVENPKNPRVLGNTNPHSWWNNWITERQYKNSIVGKLQSLGDRMAGTTPVAASTPAEAMRFGPAGVTGRVPVLAPAPIGEGMGIAAHPAAVQSQGPTLQGIAAHPSLVIKPKIEPPDTSAVSAAMAKLKLLNQPMNIKPAKIPPPDTSALTAAKGKAQAAGNGITQAIEQAMHKPAKLPPPDLSAGNAAAGKARGIGSNISAGLAAGILAGEGAVVAAATQVANAAAAAMAKAAQTHSPSKKTTKTGKDLAAGIVVGLQGGQSAIDAAATAIGKNAAKAADIATIDGAVKKLLAEVPRGDTALTRMLKADNRALDNMANTRAKLEQEISDSEQVAKNAVSGASIMNSLNAVNPAGAEPIASAAVITGQQYQATSLKQFAQSLQKLQAMGLNATSLSQIAQAGPDQGLGIAQGIASGGKDAIKQLNSIQKQIQASSAQIGNIAGPAMYQAGKDVAKGLAAGLKSELNSLDKAMEHLAKAMVSSVEKHVKTAKHAAHKAAHGTASGAAAGAGPGGSVPSAAGSGKDSLSVAASALSQSAAALSSSAAALNGAAQALKNAGGGSGSGSGSGGGHAGAGGGTVHPRVPVHAGGYGGGGHYGTGAYLPPSGGGHLHYHQAPVHVTVHGSVMAEKDLLSTLQEHQLVKASNNWQGGWQLPGRAV